MLKYKEKGSLSIEAVIAFTAFISVTFVLLNLVKLVMVSMLLNSATCETAKQFATAAYPIAFVNSAQGAAEAEVEAESISIKEGMSQAYDAAMQEIFVGGGASGSLHAGIDKMTGFFQNSAQKDVILPAVQALKGQAGAALASQIMNGYLEDSGVPINKSALRLRIVKLPQTNLEFQNTASSLKYQFVGTRSGDAFYSIDPASSPEGLDGSYNRDDVVICTEYRYTFALPFLPSVETTLRNVAVEHAWLSGGGVRTERKEGLDVSKIIGENPVYIATGGYGKCFHVEDCWGLNNARGKTAINRKAALAQGYHTCKLCNA